jgi:hypothetical protein
MKKNWKSFVGEGILGGECGLKVQIMRDMPQSLFHDKANMRITH